MPPGESILPGPYAYLIAALSGAILSAIWLSLILWTAKDIRLRSDDRLAQILAVIAAALLTVPGLILYLLLRPRRTMEEEYQSSLEEEALLASIAGRLTCPGCGRSVADDWRICPSCSTLLRKACSDCGRMLDLTWNVCPYCGTAFAAKESGAPAENES
jgi:RNA polymerase subunit RPABC4/transcription elongation factor Spt4